MGYIALAESDSPLGFYGYGEGCGCRSCKSQALSEWYVPEEDNDEPEPSPRPALPRAARVNGREVKLGYGMGQLLLSRPIEVIGGFQFDRTTVGPGEPQNRLIGVARHILASFRTPQPIRSVRLVGHTDPVGTPAYNLDL